MKRVVPAKALGALAVWCTTTLIVGTALALPYANPSVRNGLAWAWTNPSMRSELLPDLLAHLGLSGLLAAALVLGVGYARSTRSKVISPRRIAARGSTFIETLVVMPVFLLITLGILQLSINNIAAVLVNLGTFQAARTAWIFDSEAERGRYGVRRQDVEEAALIQAAVVLAPVAPSDYKMSAAGLSPQARQTRAAMVAGQMDVLVDDSGRMGSAEANNLFAEGDTDRTGSGEDLIMSESFDSSAFRVRTARKFVFAYRALDVRVRRNAEEIGVFVEYKHQQSMPIVPLLFGERDTVGGRQGYFHTYRRQFLYRKQLPANPRWPGGR